MVIGISVLGIIGVGVVGGLLTGRYGDVGVRGLVNIWAAFVDALLWVLRYPIEGAMWLILTLIQWFRDRLNPEDADEEPLAPGPPVVPCGRVPWARPGAWARGETQRLPSSA